MEFLLLVALTGFITGILSGLFGIGGALILTPFLRIFLGQPDRIALGTTLPVIIPTALFGLLGRKKEGLFRKDVFVPASLGILTGSILGSLLTGYIVIRYLMVATAFLIFVTGIKMAFRISVAPGFLSHDFKVPAIYVDLVIGFTAGLLSGLLGIGGGLVLVPGFIYLRKLTPFEATTTSLGVILVATLPGSLIHTFLGHVDWKLALLLSLTAPPGSYVASRLGLRMSGKKLEAAFGWFLILVGFIFALSEIK